MAANHRFDRLSGYENQANDQLAAKNEPKVTTLA